VKDNYKIFQDWKANNGNIKGKIVLMSYRIVRLVRYNYFLLVFFFWLLPLYVLFVEWILGIEIRWFTKIGENTQLWHGQSLVINPGAQIGSGCILRHCTTIGNKGTDKRCPEIGNNVDIGSNTCIIGPIKIGDNVVIGAGSVIVKDIPPNCVVVGNPGKIIKTNSIN